MKKEFTYIPTLAVRPAEIAGLRELPAPSKELLTPHILLRPWVGSEFLESSVKSIADAYKDPVIIEIDPTLDLNPIEGERTVFKELRALSDPSEGFKNWFEFCEKYNFIPTALHSNDKHIVSQQVERLASLGRGVFHRIRSSNNKLTLKEQSTGIEMLDSFKGRIKPDELMIILDFGQRNQGWEYQALIGQNLIQSCIKRIKIPSFVISATTFPSSFDELYAQSIYERGMFQQLRQINSSVNLIYGDRGSARAEGLDGGSGPPLPRVDLALQHNWQFFRERPYEPRDQDGKKLPSTPEQRRQWRHDAYVKAAARTAMSEHWADVPETWGRTMIEATSLGLDEGIYSPARSTAVRINLHLYKQAHYGEPVMPTTDEEWSEF